MREYLRRIRTENGETMEDVANVLGITRQYYEMIEKGKRKKSLDVQTASRLSRHYGMHIGELVEEELNWMNAKAK